MGRRRWSVIVWFAAASAAAGSVGAIGPVAASGSARVAGRSSVVTGMPERQWLQRQVLAMQRAHATVLVGKAATESHVDPAAIPPPSDLDQLVPAGDLDGNGLADVLDVREPNPVDPSHAVGVTARDGRTGKVLWGKAVAIEAGVGISVLPTRLGAHGKPGVLMVKASEQSTATGGAFSLTLRALTGATGKLLWSRTFSGTSDNAANTETGLPEFDGLIHDVPGPTRDVLVSIDTKLSTGNYQTLPDIVSGVGGAFDMPDALSSSTTGFAEDVPIPAVSGSGPDDFLVMQAGPSTGVVEAVHGHSGGLIWRNASVTLGLFDLGESVGHYSNPKTSDVEISHDINMITGLAQITILRGSNGKTEWSRQGNETYRIGRAGAHRQPVLGIDTASQVFGQPKTTNTVRLLAVAPNDSVIYRRSLTAVVRTPANVALFSSFDAVKSIGDVQRDGSADQDVELLVSASSATVSKAGNDNALVNGRTGQVHKITFEAGADGSLRHGQATDLLSVSIRHGVPRVAGWRGATAKRYYERPVPSLHHVDRASIAGLRVTANRCSAIALTTAAGSMASDSVLSARGAPLWTVLFDPAQAIGGTLIRYPAPTHFCE